MKDAKYKISKYNIYLKENDDGAVVYNSYSGSICYFDKETLEDLRSCKTDNIFFEEMLKQGFIVPDSLDEIGRIKRAHYEYVYDKHPEKMQYTIAPTLGCPLACNYCFEKNKTSKIMSDYMAKIVADYIISAMKKNPNIKRLHITWFGGEPLLGKKIILQIGKKLVRFCKKSNIVYSAKMLTSGVLLSEEILNEMIQSGVMTDIQFTLDGNKERFKKVKKGNDKQFETLMKAMRLSANNITTYIRLNVTSNNREELLELVENIAKEGVGKKYQFYAMHVVDYSSNDNDDENEVMMFEFRKKLRSVVESYGFKMNHMSEAPRTLAAFCGAMKLTNLTIGPSGEFYRCENLVGDSNYVIGNVFDGLYYSAEDMMFDTDISEKCLDCPYLPLCWEGCPVHRVIYKKNFKCELFKKQINNSILSIVKPKL